MMDGSLKEDGKSIADYDYNVDVTRKVVEMAHAIGVTVEGELGCLGSLETMKGDKEDGHGAEGTMTREMLLTDPDEAADFVKSTQLDALAIAIGTSHGAYKFTRKPTGDILAIDRIKAIHARIPNTHLVMHGSSSVPQNLLADIRAYGGDMKETYGVPVEEIQEGIKHGVRKINIDTDIRLAMTAAIRKFLHENPGKFDPREYLKPAMLAAKAICKERYEQFGCAGMAGKIKPVPLAAIATKYKTGELRQIVELASAGAPSALAGDEHRDDRGGHRPRREPAQRFQPARHGERAHHLRVVGQQHHHDHDRHGDDAVDHRAPEQRLDRVDRREVEHDAAQRRERDDRRRTRAPRAASGRARFSTRTPRPPRTPPIRRAPARPASRCR